MVERTERRRIDDGDRAPNGREWELFVRSDSDDPLRHVGSVRAPDADGAYELACRLFAWYAEDVWVCPSADVTRYTTTELTEDAPTVTPDAADGEPATGSESG